MIKKHHNESQVMSHAIISRVTTVLVLAAFSILSLCWQIVRADERCLRKVDNIQVPENFCIQRIAAELGRLGHIAVNENGDVFAALRSGTHAVVAMRDADGDGAMEQTERFGYGSATGIAIHDGSLYVGINQKILRWKLGISQLRPSSEAQTIISGFPGQIQHAAKTFTFDEKGYIYVNVGAPSNACQEKDRASGSPGQKPCPLREKQAGIWRFKLSTRTQQQADGERYATGIRNAMAIAYSPFLKNVFVVQHGRDQIHQNWPELYTMEQGVQLPAEEMLRLNKNADFGWPYCYYDPRAEKRVLAPEYGGDGKKTGDCHQYGKPMMTFPAHWAPNAMVIYDQKNFPTRFWGGAFVAFHGSWNRAPQAQQGYLVAFVPMVIDGFDPQWEIFADGFAGSNKLRSPGQAQFRPTGLAVGPGGQLYISDSKKGYIWRIAHAKN